MTWLVFRSKAHADVRMLASHAHEVLSLLGRDATRAGILLPQDVPEALAVLRSAIDQDDARRAAAAQAGRASEWSDADGAADLDDPARTLAGAVSLKRRWWPLMALMAHGAQRGEPIVWQP